MPREGFTTVTLDDKSVEILEKIMSTENCQTYPEAIRLLIRLYRNQPQNENNLKEMSNPSTMRCYASAFDDTSKMEAVE